MFPKDFETLTMHLIFIAIPFFLLLIGIEMMLDRKRGTSYYRFNDAISSLSIGTLSRITEVAIATTGISVYFWLYHHAALLNLPSHSVVVWLCGFVTYDLAYYWEHRLSHRIAIMWGSHVVHHSSEEFNLTTALRQTGSPSLFGWLIYLPMAVMGISPDLMIACASLNLIYQFWVHTRHIDKMPDWYETILVTPSHHRVHHALNCDYIDKNYAGVFILWDKLFGSFKAEADDIKIVYGVSHQLNSWNPVWANCQVYFNMILDGWRTERWSDKLSVFLKPPGWRPDDVKRRYPHTYTSSHTLIKFETRINHATQRYIAIQFIALMGLVFAFLLHSASLPSGITFLLCMAATVNLWVMSAMQTGTACVRVAEPTRLFVNSMILICFVPAHLLWVVSLAVAVYLILSLVIFRQVYSAPPQIHAEPYR